MVTPRDRSSQIATFDPAWPRGFHGIKKKKKKTTMYKELRRKKTGQDQDQILKPVPIKCSRKGTQKPSSRQSERAGLSPGVPPELSTFSSSVATPRPEDIFHSDPFSGRDKMPPSLHKKKKGNIEEIKRTKNERSPKANHLVNFFCSPLRPLTPRKSGVIRRFRKETRWCYGRWGKRGRRKKTQE